MMKRAKLIPYRIATAWLVLASVNDMLAAERHVPADYATIQAAVDAAASGDEIKIAAGVYTEQVVITNKSLTLSGSPGAVLRATAGLQSSLSAYGSENVPLLGIAMADVVVSGLTLEGERLGDSQPGTLVGVYFLGAGGRVQDCRITGFRGNALAAATNRWGRGVMAENPHDFGVGPVDVQVLRSTFADNVFSIELVGDRPWGTNATWHPESLSTSFAVNDNTIVGNGPDAVGRQFGIRITAGAGGEVKRNTIADHAYTGTTSTIPYSFGFLADDEFHFGVGNPLEALQPLHFEGNIFRNNQVHCVVVVADGSTIVNNLFEGTAPGARPTGLAFSGENVLVATNRFSDLETGILLYGDDPEYGTYLGIATNAMLIANGFCNVATNYVYEPLTTHTEQGTLICPWPELDIRAVQLSWPYSYNGYSVQTAPALNGPWSTFDATPFLQEGQNRVVVPAANNQQFFRLVKL